jgi:hypothetical protein
MSVIAWFRKLSGPLSPLGLSLWITSGLPVIRPQSYRQHSRNSEALLTRFGGPRCRVHSYYNWFHILVAASSGTPSGGFDAFD